MVTQQTQKRFRRKHNTVTLQTQKRFRRKGQAFTPKSQKRLIFNMLQTREFSQLYHEVAIVQIVVLDDGEYAPCLLAIVLDDFHLHVLVVVVSAPP